MTGNAYRHAEMVRQGQFTDCSLVGPLSGSLVISLLVILIAAQRKPPIHSSVGSLATFITTWWERLCHLHMGYLWDQGVVRVGVCQQGADRQQHLCRTTCKSVESANCVAANSLPQSLLCNAITFETVRAGLHCSLRMSRQMEPLELMLGW